MVENLLTITRIDNNSQDKVKKSPEVVEEVVSEAIQRLRKRLSDVRIKVHMPNDFLMIPMDATLIEQVLINLLENASVHSESTEEIDLIITQTKSVFLFLFVTTERESIPNSFLIYLKVSAVPEKIQTTIKESESVCQSVRRS